MGWSDAPLGAGLEGAWLDCVSPRALLYFELDAYTDKLELGADESKAGEEAVRGGFGATLLFTVAS